MSEHEQDAPLTEDEVAAANEPDEPDEPAPGDDDVPLIREPDEPTPDTEPESSAVMEEIGKKLDALNKTVATRISSILGEHANDFEVCDLCSYWNTPGWRMKGHLPEDLRAEIGALIGQRAPSQLKPDPHSAVCSTCDGEGFVGTGSKVHGQDALPCVACKGMGWIATDDARRAGLLPPANGPTQATTPLSPNDAAMQPTNPNDPPEVAKLRAQGYFVMAPVEVG